MKRASDKVEERLERAVSALEEAQVPYAIIGGLAVAAWVATVDEGAVRLTRDVDVLMREEDLPQAARALSAAGFIYRHAGGIDMFLDGPEAKASDAVHILRADYETPSGWTTPSVTPTVQLGGAEYITLPELVRTKLQVWRDKDRVHLRDMIGVGLVDASWLERVPPEFRDRLEALLDDPEG